MYDTYDFEVNGLNFRAKIRHDEDMREPWKENDGHGIVSEWTTREKRPGERVIASDRSHNRYYDVQETMAIALKDGWGCEHPEGKTKRQIAAEAVEHDYKHLAAWCNDEWHWVYITVDLLTADGDVIPGYHESLGGIESIDEDYLKETAVDLAEQIAGRVGDAEVVELALR